MEIKPRGKQLDGSRQECRNRNPAMRSQVYGEKPPLKVPVGISGDGEFKGGRSTGIQVLRKWDTGKQLLQF